MWSWFSRLLCVVVVAGVCTPALAERRLAFVAGIDAYDNLGADAQLERAVKDADTVATTLEGLNFTVTRLTSDVNQANFLRRFGNFVARLQADDVVLFYFSGHGVGLDGQNYLIPADIPKLQAGDQRLLKLRALAETDLIDDIRRQGVKFTIMVIDACRNNPFPHEGGKALGLSKGFERLDSPDGVLSIYAAGAGQEALDHLAENDTDANSVFTRVFVKYLKQPGLSLSELGDAVRDDVAGLSNRMQVPGVYGQIIGQRKIFLAGTPIEAAPPADPPVRAQTKPVVVLPPQAEDPEIAYNKAVLDNTKEAYEKLLKDFPNHPKKDLILTLYQMKTEEAVWRTIEAATNPAEKLMLLKQLLKVFPKGVFAERAASLASELDREAEPPAAAAPVDTTQRDFDTAQTGNTIEAWNSFLTLHSSGTLAELARFKLREAMSAKLPPAPAPPVQEPPASNAPVSPIPAAVNVRRLAGMDAPGNDRSAYIKGVNTIEDCERLCTADAGCAGYVYNIRRRVCIPKSAIGALVQAPEPAITGVIDARAGPPTPQHLSASPRFRYFDNLDASGDDLSGFVRGVALADCERICLSTPACGGYTYNRKRSVCIPKSHIGRLSPSPESAVTGVLIGQD